jgi:abortive infection bacteriophage resistance protein
MGNIATSITQQIEKLKERGMILDYNDAKAKEILLDIGYYRLGFYWNPFEKDKEHNFQPGTKFSDAVTLYYLDVDLRNLLLKYIKGLK